MKKTLPFYTSVLLISASVFLAGCSQNSTTSSSSSDTPAQTSATQKTGTTTKTGKIVQIDNKFFIQETGKQAAPIDSYGVNLSQYVNQTVTISGEYSGDTLFVGSIK